MPTRKSPSTKSKIPTKSKSTGLKVGDRIRIVSVPGEGILDYTIHRETKSIYRRLVARRTPVRIQWIDSDDQPWFVCKFLKKNGRFEEHWLGIFADDDNWVLVKPRRTRRVP